MKRTYLRRGKQAPTKKLESVVAPIPTPVPRKKLVVLAPPKPEMVQQPLPVIPNDPPKSRMPLARPPKPFELSEYVAPRPPLQECKRHQKELILSMPELESIPTTPPPEPEVGSRAWKLKEFVKAHFNKLNLK